MMKKDSNKNPSTRHHIDINRKDLSKAEPHKGLTYGRKRAVGRNSAGRITMRHKGAGHKKLYREIEFAQPFKGVTGKIESIEYDPYRTCFIALVLYTNGARKYVLAPANVKVGDKIICDDKTELIPGNRMLLKNIPGGTQVHNIEIRPGQGGRLARSAGSYITVSGLEGNYAYLKMPSTEVRKVLSNCFASIGVLSNVEHNLISLGKAGRSRNMGIRPTVRGSAMNPPDHPYGGGRGKTPRGTKRPKDI
jgi:large subunit ribosomal protein L2